MRNADNVTAAKQNVQDQTNFSVRCRFQQLDLTYEGLIVIAETLLRLTLIGRLQRRSSAHNSYPLTDMKNLRILLRQIKISF